jgi:dsDNA-specific endonuclease/ATPase MutS2
MLKKGLENLENVDTNKVLEALQGIYRRILGYYELKQHKPWFHEEECSKLLDQTKQAKFQWLQNSSHINGDNMNSIRHETS